MKLTFDDVLIEPDFNFIHSRKCVKLDTFLAGLCLRLPVISSNMDTVTGVEMAVTMASSGGAGCLHRFTSIKDNMKEYLSVREMGCDAIVSIGLGQKERVRAKCLHKVGARYFCIDVAHGASEMMVEQMDWLYHKYENVEVIVGNFGSAKSVDKFLSIAEHTPAAIKVGIGPGSACTTRLKTGCGFPQISAIKEIKETVKWRDIAVIADGGMKTPGDIAKALAAGADAVMLGGMLSGTYETPNVQKNLLNMTFTADKTKAYREKDGKVLNDYKTVYRGSASKESYEDQGKDESWRTAEGEAFMVAYKGPVELILKDIEGGLRSAFTYVGAMNLKEFQEQAKFVRVSPSTVKENRAHGKE